MERNGERDSNYFRAALLHCLCCCCMLRMPTAVPKPAPFGSLFVLPSCSIQIQQTCKGREGVNGKMLRVNGKMLRVNGKMLRVNGKMLRVNGKMLGVNGKMLGVNNAGAHRKGRRIPSKQEGSGSGSFLLPYFFHTLLPLSLNTTAFKQHIIFSVLLT